jgi:hypothetical protein
MPPIHVGYAPELTSRAVSGGRCLFIYLTAGHWFACFLVLTANSSDTPMHTWLARKGFCARTDDPSTLPPATWELQPVPPVPHLSYLDDVYCVSGFDMWAGSYYWMSSHARSRTRKPPPPHSPPAHLGLGVHPITQTPNHQ